MSRGRVISEDNRFHFPCWPISWADHKTLVGRKIHNRSSLIFVATTTTGTTSCSN